MLGKLKLFLKKGKKAPSSFDRPSSPSFFRPKTPSTPHPAATRTDTQSSTEPVKTLAPAARVFESEYTLGQTLGNGAFAEVKNCVRKSDGSKFAVKIINKSRLHGKLDLLRNEVEILQSIHHNHIIQLHDVFENEENMYLVTTLATGGELFDQIIKKGNYTERDAALLVYQLFDAIAYLHRKNIVHRDLKPENMLFLNHSEDSPLMLTDFGLSKIASGDSNLHTACGTPSYVAPEILSQDGHGKPVDVWSMGVITFVLLSGYTPFYAEDQPTLFAQIMTADYAFDPDPWDTISASAKDLIRKLLVVDPSKRLTAEEALRHPWFTEAAGTTHLKHVTENLSARKRLKKSITMVIGLNRLRHLSLDRKGKK
ncbi:briggsae CBR-CMK-1 protein [Polychytrium aggregatum]|uniref:briggsae CBR-CMK-1 protein n=1 Tax=Polychytrium aggregatum TaxID=110093 RepID=UPI0022FEB879|nr:briggsae CBR-CMK-1 protein [Polychytrium aggregatum]KAI9202021.1 briggsae CBR-CMK-1 protein [Polychytrium aggregatum]